MSKTRIAIAGAGNIAQNAHLPAYLKRDDVEIVAVCDIDMGRAEACAAKFSIPRAFQSAREMIRETACDAVDICVWNRSHMEVAVLAAEAGRHILCEKPMAVNLQHAQAMRDAVEKTGVTLMMAMPMRFDPAVQYVEKLSRSGKMGDIYYARATMVRRRGTPLGWFTDTHKSGGGPLIDIGVHAIDCAWYMLGRPKPTRVSASTSYAIGDYQTKGVTRWVAQGSDVTAFDTEDSAAGVVHFENGATLFFDISWAMNRENEQSTLLCGSLAGAKLCHGADAADPIVIYGEAEAYLTDNRPKLDTRNLFEEEIDCFLRCLREGRKPDAGLYDGMTVMRMLTGAYESAKEGREIIL